MFFSFVSILISKHSVSFTRNWLGHLPNNLKVIQRLLNFGKRWKWTTAAAERQEEKNFHSFRMLTLCVFSHKNGDNLTAAAPVYYGGQNRTQFENKKEKKLKKLQKNEFSTWKSLIFYSEPSLALSFSMRAYLFLSNFHILFSIIFNMRWCGRDKRQRSQQQLSYMSLYAETDHSLDFRCMRMYELYGRIH